MLRFLPLGLLVLIVTSCVGGATSAPRLTDVSAPHALASHPTTADNRRAARRSAAKLLDRIVLPSAAVRLGAEPAGDRGLLRTAWRGGGDVADPHRFWRVREPLGSALAFITAHPPSGSQKPFLGWGRELAARMGEFDFPPFARRVWSRRVLVELVPLPHGWTGVRGDGEAAWVVERSAANRVPEGVRQVDVRAPKFAKRVTNPVKVGTIVRLFNALPLSRSGGKCAVPTPRIVRVAFRSAGGAALARAAVPEIYPGCVGITLTIESRQLPGYIGDQIRFLRSLQRLLGVRFSLPTPP